MSAFAHDPVMVEEITAAFAPVPDGVVVDATLGGGGHTERLLDTYPGLSVVGLDRDAAALDAAGSRLARFGVRVVTHHCRFDRLDEALDEDRVERISGAIFDLGVSSPQLDRADRGFSYRNDGPLDMRMDSTQSWSATDVVNGYDAERLTRIIRQFGDERFASRIAAAIVRDRPISSTARLAEVVVAAIPAAARRTGGHPAKRTFQAIRMEVNNELEALPVALDAAIERTVPGGRIAVLAYHSGEDRIVKGRFRQAETGGCLCPPELPCVCDAVQTVRVVRGIAKRPSAAEQQRNRRATSARLRIVERVHPHRRGEGS